MAADSVARVLEKAGCPGTWHEVMAAAAACAREEFHEVADFDSAGDFRTMKAFAGMPDKIIAFLNDLASGASKDGNTASAQHVEACVTIKRRRLVIKSTRCVDYVVGQLLCYKLRDHAVVSRGPTAAVRGLDKALFDSEDGRYEWVRRARMDAIIGSAPLSIPSAISALRCWGAFADKALGANGDHFPPTIEGLLSWSRLFRCSRTFANYVAKVRLACHIADVSATNVDDPAIACAKAAIRKAEPPPMPKLFIKKPLLVRLWRAARLEGDMVTACLYLMAYTFMLRVPSEALPLRVGSVGMSERPELGAHSACAIIDGSLVLCLSRRKNRQHGSRLTREGWCDRDSETCPVHVLGAWLTTFLVGAHPFSSISAARALANLRGHLVLLGVDKARHYRLHDFRRGHAQDMSENGATLCEILAAGEWRSPAFLVYLDAAELETRAVIEACQAESGGESD
jgi:hypothetical protein